MANKKKKGSNNAKAANKAKSAKHANELSSQEFEAQLRAASGKNKFKPVVQEKEVEEETDGIRGKELKKKSLNYDDSSDVNLDFERLFVTLDGRGRPMAARTTESLAFIIVYDHAPTPSDPHRLVPRLHDAIPEDEDVEELYPLMVHVGNGLMFPEDLPGRRKKEAQDWADWDTLLHEARVGCEVLWYEWVHAYTTPFEPPFIVCEGWRAQRILDCCAFEDPELDRLLSPGGSDEDDIVQGEEVEDIEFDDDSSSLSDLSDQSEWSDIIDMIDDDMLQRMLQTAREAGRHEVNLADATPLPPPQEPHPTEGNLI